MQIISWIGLSFADHESEATVTESLRLSSNLLALGGEGPYAARFHPDLDLGQGH